MVDDGDARISRRLRSCRPTLLGIMHCEVWTCPRAIQGMNPIFRSLDVTPSPS